ncbi:MAG: hypothetical protein Kow0031_29740 [Anaerolineae bacterium]
MAYRVNTEPGLVSIEFFSTFSPDDLVQLAELAEEVERQTDPAPNRLVDMRNLSGVEIRFPDMDWLAKRRRTQRLKNPVKTAIVASRPLPVGYGRMFQELMDHPQIEIKLFSTVEAARLWLAGVSESGTGEP